MKKISKINWKRYKESKSGKEAITHFKVLERFVTQNGSYSLLELRGSATQSPSITSLYFIVSFL